MRKRRRTVGDIRKLLRGYPQDMIVHVGSQSDERQSWDISTLKVRRVRLRDGTVSSRADSDVLVLIPK